MDTLLSVFEKNFDSYYVFLVLIGNNFLWELNFYSEYLLQKVKKVYLTALHSLLLGLLYYYVSNLSGAEIEVKALLNSYFLATSVYELGLKDVLSYLKQNGAKLLINKIKSHNDNGSSGAL